MKNIKHQEAQKRARHIAYLKEYFLGTCTLCAKQLKRLTLTPEGKIKVFQSHLRKCKVMPFMHNI